LALDADQCASALARLVLPTRSVAREGEKMTPGYEVRKTTQTLAGKTILVVHVLRDDGNGGAEMVRIPCPDAAEQNRIAGELDELLNELLARS